MSINLPSSFVPIEEFNQSQDEVQSLNMPSSFVPIEEFQSPEQLAPQESFVADQQVEPPIPTDARGGFNLVALPSPLNNTQQKMVDSAKRFEDSKLGKVGKVLTSIPDFILGTKPLSQQLYEDFERKNKVQDERKSLLDSTIGLADKALADGIQQGAKFAPFVLGSGAMAQGAGLARFLGIMKNAIKVGGVTGGSKAIEKLAEGDDLGAALKKGLGAGGVSAVLSGGIEGVVPLSKAIVKTGVKAFSNVKSWAIDAAMINPEILIKKQDTLLDVVQNINSTNTGFTEKIRQTFDDQLNSLNIPEFTGNLFKKESPLKRLQQFKSQGIPVVKTKEVAKIIKELDLSKNIVKKKILDEAKRNAKEIADDTIDRLINGEIVSFQEARKINSLLGSIERRLPGDEIASEFISSAGQIKRSLFNSLSDSVPSIKPIHTEYAKNIELAKKMKKMFGKLDTAENRVFSLGKEASQRSSKKSNILNEIAEFDNLNSTNFLKQIRNSAVSHEFINTNATKLIQSARMGSGGLLGWASLGPAGILPGIVGASVLGSPAATKSILKAGQAVGPAANVIQQGLKRVGPALGGAQF